jgi:hypothetical protein
MSGRPVNHFRILLSHYLRQPLPQLPDRTFCGRWTRPSTVSDVTGAVWGEGCAKWPEPERVVVNP